MKLRNTAIALGIGAATATGLSLLQVNKDLVVGSTAVVFGAGLMISLKDKNDINLKARNYEYYFNRAQDKFELADYEEAILDYNKALELSPTEICLVYSMRGNAKRNSGDFDGAIQDYSQVLKINPKDSDAFFNRANVKKEIEDMKGACEDWRKAADLGDDDATKFLREHCE